MRTRAQVSAFKQIAIEAGILTVEFQPGAVHPRLNTKIEDSVDESEADTFDPAPRLKKSLTDVSRTESSQTWLAWDNFHGEQPSNDQVSDF